MSSDHSPSELDSYVSTGSRSDELSDLVEFVERAAGGTLRGIASFDEHGIVDHIYNADVVTDNPELRREVHEWVVDRCESSGPEMDATFGHVVAELTLREHAFVLTLATRPTEGVVVSLTPDAGRNLSSFVQACLERMPDADDHPLPRIDDFDRTGGAV